MTIKLHTQTSVPNTAQATSVSPLEPSGSTNTKFSETNVYQHKTLKTAIVKLISDIENNRCMRLAYREAIAGLPQEYANKIVRCIHRHNDFQTLSELRELAMCTLDMIIVIEVEGVQTRMNYGGKSAEFVVELLTYHHLKGLTAWLEME